MVNEDGGLTLEVIERQALPCETDRRSAWWAVIMAMALAILASITAVLFAVQTLAANNRVNEMQKTIREQDQALNCRAEANGALQTAIAAANTAANELTVEIADQFYTVLNDQRPSPTALRAKIATSREALEAARQQTAIYERTVGQCALEQED